MAINRDPLSLDMGRLNTDQHFAEIFEFFKKETKATDAVCQIGRPPRVRINGDMVDTQLKNITLKDMERFFESLPGGQKAAYKEILSADLSYEVYGIRYRLNVFSQRGAISVAIRRIPDTAPVFVERFGNDSKTLADLLRKKQGFVIFSGPSGAGKTSSLASCIDYMNTNYLYHIVTIEDPIEYLHSPKTAFISQREVGYDVKSFYDGLKQSFRQSADVAVVGEVRDYVTFDTALQSAETGRLVLTTVHAHNIQETVSRMMGLVNTNEAYAIRCRFAESISAIISQRLVAAKDTGDDRILVYEIIVADKAVRNIIREGRENQLTTEIHRQNQMTINQKLDRLYHHEKIDRQELMAHKVME